MNAVKSLGKVFTPSFYKEAYCRMVESTRKDVHNNSIRPLFKFMLIVGTGGYAMEYYMHGSE
jgi:hypothetical protein